MNSRSLNHSTRRYRTRPPKTAFASAAGPRSSRTFDSPNRGNFLDDEAKAERTQHKDRFKDTSRRDKDSQKSVDDKPENLRIVRMIAGAVRGNHEHPSVREIVIFGETETEIKGKIRITAEM